MFDRRLVKNFDWPILVVTILILIVGGLSLYSALDVTGEHLNSARYFFRQLCWIGIGFIAMILVLLIDYQAFQSVAYPLYWGGIATLILVHMLGKTSLGAQRWITIMGVNIQPSEFMKIIVIIAVARYFSLLSGSKPPSLKELAPGVGLVMLPAILIAKQPDLGTALSIIIICGSIIAFVGIRKRYLVTGFILAIATIYPVWHYYLKPYQKHRVLVYLGLIKDFKGIGYHIYQSKIAVGSGTLFGKGFLCGTQHLLQFLPEHHTDFIFSVWAEEWGFVGCVALIGLYVILTLLGLNVARKAKNKFGTLLAFGITAMIFWQAAINIGMVLGLLPVVGITLPLISYGGSSMLTTLISIGILLNISMRKYMFQS